MSLAIGLDIGGTKIAGASYDGQGREIARIEHPTPNNYPAFLETCRATVAELRGAQPATIGIGIRGIFDRATGAMQQDVNLPYLSGVSLRNDLEKTLGHKIVLENDANCAALAEAIDGAGAGCASCFTLIVGTGVGGGLVVDGKVIAGVNGFCGEIGHLPLPFCEASDGEPTQCGCGLTNCIEKRINGAALARLHQSLSGETLDSRQIADLASAGNAAALKTLDRYYTIFAKAMIAILNSFDPDVIVVSGGLNGLPGLYQAVPQRWGRYALTRNPKTRFVAARFGAMAGLRGAALLGSAPALPSR